MRFYISISIIGLFIAVSGIFLIARGGSENAFGSLDIFPEIDFSSSSTKSASMAERTTESAPPEGYVEYRNNRYGFRFYHSQGSLVKEFEEGQGAMTVVIENEEEARGFQIFIVPYADSVITEERFRIDVPSGVRENAEKTYVGELGVNAVTFNSYNQFLGETREVWFIHKGFLFEITAPADAVDWLSTSMQTWRFL